MPRTAEMNVFNAQVGSYQELMPHGDLKNGAIVADALDQRASGGVLGQSAYAFN
jgi:hypothetical protein